MRTWKRKVGRYPWRHALGAMRLALLISVCAVLAAGKGSGAEATTSSPAVVAAVEPAPSIYDRIWKHATVYDSDENPVVQRAHFTGRFQIDLAALDHEDFDRLEVRRWRLGGKMQIFDDFTVHCEVDLDPDEAPWYQGLTDAYVAWSRSNRFVITAGKHSAPFTVDGATSSKELLTIDRANLANNLWFPEEYFPGISVSGKDGPWRYRVGSYSSGSANKEFGNFDGRYFLLTSVGYDFAGHWEVDEAVLTTDYVYNVEDSDNTFTRSLNQVASLNFKLATGPWGIRTDVAGGIGYLDQSDLWGAVLMPFYNLTSKLQVVGRYTYVNSFGDNGLRFARYESFLDPGQGDEYHEAYAGLNYYFYGHKLKMQTGIDYVEMKDTANDGGAYSGWGWITALRASW